MAQFIVSAVVYPKLSREMGEQGIVYVSYFVEEDGSITEVKIRKGVSDALDAESIRVIKLMPNWIPCNDHGRTKRINFTVPIHYRLG